MADVVAEGGGLDEIEVEPERATDVPSHPRHKLHVQATTGEVVVGPKRKDLGLAVESVVGGHVHDLLGVAHEGGAKGRAFVEPGLAPNGNEVGGRKGRELARGALVTDSAFRSLRKAFP